MSIPLPILAGEKQYWQKIRAMFGSSLIGYWPLDELSGTVARDVSGNGRDGAYRDTGVTYAQAGIKGGRSVLLDGTGYINAQTAGLAAAFNGLEGTVLVWVKLPDWSGTGVKTFVRIQVDASNLLIIRKGPTAGTLDYYFTAGGTSHVTAGIAYTNTNFVAYAMTWSKSGNKLSKYAAGSLATAEGGYLGSGWAGAPTLALFGAGATTPSETLVGYEAHAFILNRAATANEIARVSSPL